MFACPLFSAIVSARGAYYFVLSAMEVRFWDANCIPEHLFSDSASHEIGYLPRGPLSTALQEEQWYSKLLISCLNLVFIEIASQFHRALR